MKKILLFASLLFSAYAHADYSGMFTCAGPYSCVYPSYLGIKFPDGSVQTTAATGGGGGITTIGALDGNGPSADALSIVGGTTLFGSSADDTHPGMISLFTQYMGNGTKIFPNNLGVDVIIDVGTHTAIRVNTKSLIDNANQPSVDWGQNFLARSTDGASTVDWGQSLLLDADTGVTSVNWSARQLVDANGDTIFDWLLTNPSLHARRLVNVGNPVGAQDAVTLNYINTHSPVFSGLTTDGVIYATSATAVASSSAGTVGQPLVSNGGSGSAPTFQSSVLLTQIKDTSNVQAIDVTNRILATSGGDPSIDWQNRHYFGPSSDLMMDLSGANPDFQSHRLVNLQDPLDPGDAINLGYGDANYANFTHPILLGNVLDGTTATDGGLGLVNRTLFAQSATLTKPGLVNTLDNQVFGGRKIFSNGLNTGGVFNSAATQVLDADNRTLYDDNGVATIFFKSNERLLTSAAGNGTVDYNNRWLQNQDAGVSLNWGNDQLSDNNFGTLSFDWNLRQAYDSGGAPSIDYEARDLFDNAANVSVDWVNRLMKDGSGNIVMDWNNRRFIYPNGTEVLNWATSGQLRLTAGSLANSIQYTNALKALTSLPPATDGQILTQVSNLPSWQNNPAATATNQDTPSTIVKRSASNTFEIAGINDDSHVASSNFNTRILTDATNIGSINWNSRNLYTSGGVSAMDWENGFLLDGTGNSCVSWVNRQLIDSATSVSIDWDVRGLYDTLGHKTLDYSTTNLVKFPTLTASTSVYLDASKALTSVPAGTNGQVLIQTGGIPVWGAAPTTGITTLTGDVTAGPGTGSQAATVSFVAGKSAAQVATSVNLTAAATASNTASTLVLRDGSGNTAINRLVDNSANVSINPIGRSLVDASGVISMDYGSRALLDTTGGLCVDWNNRRFIYPNGTEVMNWATSGQLTLSAGSIANSVQYTDSGKVLQSLPPATDGQVLTQVSNLPAWRDSIAKVTTQTTVSGSTSGNCVFSENTLGATDMKIVIFCTALVGTASYTYPTAMAQTPAILTTNGAASSVVTSVSNTAVTITGATTSGFIFLEGY